MAADGAVAMTAAAGVAEAVTMAVAGVAEAEATEAIVPETTMALEAAARARAAEPPMTKAAGPDASAERTRFAAGMAKTMLEGATVIKPGRKLARAELTIGSRHGPAPRGVRMI